jgi:hypothetical protein
MNKMLYIAREESLEVIGVSKGLDDAEEKTFAPSYVSLENPA